jgi:hypothetical protein
LTMELPSLPSLAALNSATGITPKPSGVGTSLHLERYRTHISSLDWLKLFSVLSSVSCGYTQRVKTIFDTLPGILIIFFWREVAKPTFHHFLPPVYRMIERIGFLLPRRHFTPASEYKRVPRLPDDTLPSLSELPALVRSVRRARSDSVGPQSAADAYETLAYREKRRRESHVSSPAPRDVDKYEKEMGTGYIDMKAVARGNHDLEGDEEQSEGEEEREVFRRIEPFKPRVRYDVEVVTKLVVYAGKYCSFDSACTGTDVRAGIAWWAVEGTPIIFELVGLGLGVQRLEWR